MAVLSFSSTIRDRVSRTLFSAAHTSLLTWQQAIVDDAGAIAFGRIKQVGQYFIDALTVDPAPESWETWLYAEAVAVASTNQTPERMSAIREQVKASRDIALGAYDFLPASDNTVAALTLQEIRRYVASALIRREVYPSVRMIDFAVQWALSTVWNRKNWSFRQRSVTLTIADDSTVSVSDSVTLDSINTERLWYTDQGGLYLQWVSADEMARLQAITTDAGRPQYFRAFWTSSGWSWLFWPDPDASYTVHTEVLTVGPPTITVATGDGSTTPFAAYPVAFVPVLLDVVLAKVMTQLGMPDSKRAMDTAFDEVDVLLPSYESMGRPINNNMTIPDDNGDFDAVMR